MPSISFLDFPREIRDTILEYAVICLERDPPLFAQLRSDNRYTVPKEVSKAFSSPAIERVMFENPPILDTFASLCLVSRQIRVEVADVIRRITASRPDYYIDLVYRKDVTIWPTWTYIPKLEQHANAVHATFRIFHCPPELCMSHSNRMFEQYSWANTRRIVWVFVHPLLVFLKCGPWPRSFSENWDSHSPGISMRKLIIDFLPAAESNILPLGAPSPLCEVQDTMGGRIRIDYFERFSSKSPTTEDESSPGLQAARQLADFVHGYLKDLCCLGLSVLPRASILYEHIGAIEFRLDGKFYHSIDLSGFTLESEMDRYSPTSSVRDFADWIIYAARKREEIGLPVKPFNTNVLEFIRRFSSSI